MKNKVSLLSCLKRYIKGLQPIYITVNNNVIQPNQLLTGKTALITGASRGIGYAIAKLFIESGATVIAIAKNREHLEKAKTELGNNYIPLSCNLLECNKADKIVADAIQLAPTKKIHILVNCAGIKNGQEERFWEFSPQDFDDILNINVKTPFFISRSVIRHMINNQIKGHIVNIIGIKGFIGEASPYSVSKFGLNTLTKGMARMFASQGIVINGIAPGATYSGPNIAQNPDRNFYHPGTSNMRLADPLEIANIALLLASDMGNNLVGSIIISDGGEILQYSNNRY